MNDSNSRTPGHWMLGNAVTFWQGEFATARRELEEAYALYDPSEQRANTLALQIDPGVNALCHLSWVLWLLGFPDQAVQTSDEALATARELAQPFTVAMALFFACTTRASCGQHDVMRPLLDELTTVSATNKLRYLGSCAHVLKGQSLIAHDHFAAGLEQIDRAFAEFAAQEAGVGLPWAMSFAVDAYTRMGRTDEALATLTKALAAVERSGERHWQAELLRLQGDLAETVGPVGGRGGILLSPRHRHRKGPGREVARVACDDEPCPAARAPGQVGHGRRPRARDPRLVCREPGDPRHARCRAKVTRR